MSQQLTLSSLFSVLALASLCIVTSVQDWAGSDQRAAPATAAAAPSAVLSIQAELAPGLLGN